MSNFAFLESTWPTLYAEAVKAEEQVSRDPRTACFYARRTLELTVYWLYDADAALRRPRQERGLASLMFEPTFVRLVEPRIRTKMDVIRKRGNGAVHGKRPIAEKEAAVVVSELFHVLFWVARTYARKPEQAPPTGLGFDVSFIALAPSLGVRRLTHAALRRMAEAQALEDARLAETREQSAELSAQLQVLREEVAQAKAVNLRQVDEHDYDEQVTRGFYIDTLLNEAGWSLEGDHDREFRVQGMPNPSGVGYVDYVLWGDDGKPLAVVEAKRAQVDPRNGAQQAKLYADCLEQQFGQRPVIFYSNGYDTWLWDDLRYPARQVQGFYTKEELSLLIGRRATSRALQGTPISSMIVERPYQHRAIRRIGETFEAEHQRGALVVMATGAGKTRTVIALIDVMMRAGWVKRALFLADRVALVNQTVRAFKTHLPDAGTVNLLTDKDETGRVYVATYPTMMGRIGETEGGQRPFGPGFFDLVVIDEAHRSVYQKYGAIFAYFDSLLVGLTATPKDEVHRNTYALFDLEPGIPTDAYGLEEAVRDGYLVPPRALRLPLKFPREGLRYDERSEAEREEWEEQDWGDEGEMPLAVAPDAVNRWLFNADTIDKVLATLMESGHKVAGGDRLGKTIVFAQNSDHADYIAARFDKNYPEYAGSFAKVITFRTKYAQKLIDDFSVADREPHIAISVDMLDTGIDVPEVVNLVFFKTVRSPTKFWQMLGRGTRLCPDLFGPGQDKRDFRVFDCCGNIEFFNETIQPAQDSSRASLGERLFNERLELVMALEESADGEGDGTSSEGGLRRDAIELLRGQLEGMNLENFLVRPHRRWVEHYRQADPWQRLDLEGARELSRLGGLPSAAGEKDELAKRFDLIVLRLQLCRLRNEPGEDVARGQVLEIAAGLLEQLSIPAIREQEGLLREVAEDEWWRDVTVPMLERVRRKLRGLVRLLDRRKRVFVYTNFVDELGEVSEVELRGLSRGTDFERFREKARAYLLAHEDHVALQKLRRNRQLTRTDLEGLEQMLVAADLGEAADLERARREAHGLGLFIRSLVGLERCAASEALAGFIDGRILSANQLDFVSLVVDHLTQNGSMDIGRLYESPFTDVAAQGPEELFPQKDVEELIAVIDAVRASAEPTDRAA